MQNRNAVAGGASAKDLLVQRSGKRDRALSVESTSDGPVCQEFIFQIIRFNMPAKEVQTR